MSLEAYQGVMRRLGIGKALLASFDSCPDLALIHQALTDDGEVFRGLGLPLGQDRTTMERAVAAQYDAGFVGLRLTTSDIETHPWLLDITSERRGFVLVVGDLTTVAGSLARYLTKTGDGLVLGGHFSAPGDPGMLDQSPLAQLVEQPGFATVCSRQGHFPAELVETWMRGLIARLGWRRLLWGSEAPVLFWRDEPVAATPHWIERFDPTDTDRHDFFTGNAQRLIFDRPLTPPAELKLPFNPMIGLDPSQAPMWPFGLAVRTDIAGRLVAGWLAWGGEDRGPLSAYLGEVLDAALPVLEP